MESGQMKKQRGLQIVLSAAVASGQLAAGLTAFSEDVQLRPAPAQVSLQSIPTAQSTVLPVVYLPFTASPDDRRQPKTSVNAELQKLMQQSQAGPARKQPATGTSNIQLVQMSQNSPSEAQAASEGKPKKAGFFKRLFSGPRKKQIPGVGEPAPPIPRPPTISYETNSSRRNKSTRKNQVPAVAVSLRSTPSNSGQKASSTGTNSTLNFQNGLQNQKSGTANSIQQAPVQRMIQEADGFINPFDAEELTLEEETLLDLDSLIEESPATATFVLQTVTELPQATAETLEDFTVNELPVTPNGPFTGYQLDVAEQAKRQLEDVAVPAPRVVSQQQVRSLKAESREVAVRQLPTVESTPEPSPENQRGEVFQIPLLEEPAMALPVVETTVEVPRQQQQLQIQSIPLLEEEPVRTPERRLEPSTPPQQVSIAVPPAIPATEVAIQKPVIALRSSAERMAALERQARRDQQSYRIMSRTGQTGFKGFCPVELRDNRQLVDSRPEYKAKFGLQTYHFSSPESKVAFEANPARYAPAVGGSDIVLMVNSNEEVVGNLEFSLWYRDRLYLFRSRETRKLFADDPTRFADQF